MLHKWDLGSRVLKYRLKECIGSHFKLRMGTEGLRYETPREPTKCLSRRQDPVKPFPIVITDVHRSPLSLMFSQFYLVAQVGRYLIIYFIARSALGR